MRRIGLLLFIVGLLTTVEAGIAFSINHTGWSIGGIVLGLGIGATGVMIFLTDLIIWMFVRGSSHVIHSDSLRLRLEIHEKESS